MKFPWTTSIVDVLKNDSKLDDKLQHVSKCKFSLKTAKMCFNFFVLALQRSSITKKTSAKWLKNSDPL